MSGELYRGIEEDRAFVHTGLAELEKTGQFDIPNDKSSEGRLVIISGDPIMTVYQITELMPKTATALCTGLNVEPFEIEVSNLLDAKAMHEVSRDLTVELRIRQTVQPLLDLESEIDPN